MRIAATLISTLAFLLCSCSLEPQSKFDAKAALNQLKGPETGTMDDALLLQAHQAESSGDYKQAAQTYKLLADKDPKNIVYKLSLADNLRRAGDNDTALRVVDLVIEKDPHNAEAYEDKGLCLMNTGEFADAGKAFGEAMKYDKKRWRTLNAIGILFAMKNKDQDAFDYYQAALDVSTDNPSVLNNMGLTLAMDKQYDKSIEALERARRHVPNDSPQVKNIDLNLALVFAIDGRLDAAEQTAAPHLTKEGLYNNMGFYAYLAKNTDMAKGYLNMALTQSPVYYERAWKNLSLVSGDALSDPNASGDSPAMHFDSSMSPSSGNANEVDFSSFGTSHSSNASDNASETPALPPAQVSQSPNPAVAPSTSITPAANTAVQPESALTPASNSASASGMNPDIVLHSASSTVADTPLNPATEKPASTATTAADDDSQKAIADIEKTDVAPGTKGGSNAGKPAAATNTTN
jgi:Flp pilus assembly protein TadD